MTQSRLALSQLFRISLPFVFGWIYWKAVVKKLMRIDCNYDPIPFVDEVQVRHHLPDLSGIEAIKPEYSSRLRHRQPNDRGSRSITVTEHNLRLQAKAGPTAERDN